MIKFLAFLAVMCLVQFLVKCDENEEMEMLKAYCAGEANATQLVKAIRECEKSSCTPQEMDNAAKCFETVFGAKQPEYVLRKRLKLRSNSLITHYF